MRVALLSLSLLLAAAAAAQEGEQTEKASVHYLVDTTPRAKSKVNVKMTVEGVGGKTVSLAMPAWAPGAYRIRNYHKGVSGVVASSGGKQLKIARPDEQTWTVTTNDASSFTVVYTVEIPDRSRGGISKDHCDLQGPDTYMYIVGRKEIPCSVSFSLPPKWKVATGLEKEGDTYRARDYDTFIDCPTELGTFDLRSFELGKVRYEVAVHSIGRYDMDALVKLCRRIVMEQMRLFHGAPFKRYLFLYHFREGTAGSGLEHLNSTSISIPHGAVEDSVDIVAGITSHEFFHAWNVKRIRPEMLGPFDYTREVRTKDLWWYEGVSDYYSELLLARAGVWSRKEFLDAVETQVEDLRSNPDRLRTSAEKASWTAWDRRDGPRISYYNKGYLLGMLLDLVIRRETQSRLSLDDVMRFLYNWFVVRGGGPIGTGHEEGDIERALTAVSGFDFRDFFAKYVSGLEELPYEEILRFAGVEVEITELKTPDLGVYLRGNRVTGVAPASTTPLEAGDRILRIDGREVPRWGARDLVADLRIGDVVTVIVWRDKREKKVAVNVEARTRAFCDRDSWLTGNP
ncbi:MAG: M61 family metallopeptidase [Planctomycetota bacterium]|jgi:predicted metalloprotease with PDZ domain